MTEFAFTHELRTYLLGIDPSTWQQIRAEVRWRYTKRSWVPPLKLAKFMDFLPEHPQEWARYADEITKARDVRKVRGPHKLKKVRDRTDYQRMYMRKYRKRRLLARPL